MRSADLSTRVQSIRSTLYALETQVDRGGIPVQALAEFKAAVDDIRLRVWNIMAASASRDARNALERFRIRRAMEITRSVVEGLRSGSIGSDIEELPDLQQWAGSLLLAVDAVRVGRG